MPDIGTVDSMRLDGELQYLHARDYLRASVNVLRKAGFTFTRGLECDVKSSIPINAGTSSSSAFVVTWMQTLCMISDQTRTLAGEELASLAHQAEVLEFGEPGGMMDHYATAIGGVIYLDPEHPRSVKRLTPRLGSFVLADSGQAKETTSILARVKHGVLTMVQTLRDDFPDFSLQTVTSEETESFRDGLSEEDFSLLVATIANRDITREALDVLRQERVDHRLLGALLNRHQSYLRHPLGISTDKIDSMIQAAYDAGALGAKINGSGGGGCMFAYAPENAEEVRESLLRFGKAWIVEVDEGTRIEHE